MFLELCLGLITTLLLWSYLATRRRKCILKESNIGGPSTLPLLGTSHHFIKATPETLFDEITSLLKEHGKTFCTWKWNECTVLTSDVKLIEALLTSQQVITKNKLYDLLIGWLGTGLLLSNGKKWHKRRKIITPTFHFKILEQFIDVFDQQSSIMVEKLYKHADGRTLDIYPLVCSAALDIIAETSMGVKINAQMAPDFPYVKAVTTVNEIFAVRFIKPLQRFDAITRITAPFSYRKQQKSIKLMHKFTDKVIEDRRNMLEESIANGTYESVDELINEVGLKKRMALLDVLLQATVDGNPLTNHDIREEVDTFMFEGHDTTTTGISHTLYLISRHANVQKRLFEEIHSVLGDDKSRPIKMCDMHEMKYLEHVIKESLRLYPPVPLIGRYFDEDVVLNGVLYPADCNILVLIYHLMRDRDYFPEPDAFKPERFETMQMDPFAYVPFSAGPRNCIGQKFAMLEMKSTISKVLRHFELLPLGEDVCPQANIVLRSTTGTQLGLKPRVY